MQNEIIGKIPEVLLVNKPIGWTSFDVVKKVRGRFKVKVGHAGTLDPLASGLLILCLGKNTKNIQAFQDLPKSYEGTMVLGKTTPSHDLETSFNEEKKIDHLSESLIRSITDSFLGEQMQLPPTYSACKVKGKRAYISARAGEKVELKARPISIFDFTITSIVLPKVTFSVTCSKGTYIRSLVRDFGAKIGTGAYLSSLCRTKIGDYSLDDAVEVKTL